MARTARRPPQWQVHTSMPKVRCSAVAQSSRGRFGFLVAPGAGLGGGDADSITSARRLALGAKTPWSR